MHRRWIFIVLQTVVTVGLLAFFFRDPEFRREAADALRSVQPAWLLLGVAIAGIENLCGVLRWRVFLRMLGIDLPFWKSVQVCLVALFCNTFLLGAAGGDLVRAAYLIRRGADKTDALMSVILDRVSGLGALILYTGILTAAHWDWLMSGSTSALLLKFVIAYQVVCLALVIGALVLALRGVTERLPAWAPFPEFVRKLGAGYAKMATHWRGSMAAMSMSLAMLAFYFGAFYCAARGLGLDLSFWRFSTLMPIADIISALPISIGGMGVRESVFVTLLGELTGTPAGVAVSVSLAGYLVNSLWGLVGAAILPLFKGIVRDARRTTAVD